MKKIKILLIIFIFAGICFGYRSGSGTGSSNTLYNQMTSSYGSARPNISNLSNNAGYTTMTDVNAWYYTIDHNEFDPLFIFWLSTFDNNEIDPYMPIHLSAYDHNDIADGETAYSWGNHAGLYLGINHDACEVTATKISNWDTTYGWGNHALQNYLDLDTYPNTDTNSLDDVVDSDFTSSGYMKTNGSGVYSADGNTFSLSGHTHDFNDTVSGSELDGVFSTTGLLRRTGEATYSTDANTYYQSGDSPVFAGATIGSISDVLKATSGVVAGIGSPTKNYVLMYNGSVPVWVAAASGQHLPTFTFGISSWTLKSSGVTVETTQEMGPVSTQWKAAAGLTVQAAFTNGNPDATPHCDKTGPGWAADLNLTTAPTYTDAVNSAYVTNYPSAINGTRAFILHAIQAPDSEVKSTITITFKNKKYYGFNSSNNILNDANIIALEKNGWVGSSKDDLDTSTVTLTPSGFQYVHFIYPSRLDPTTITFYLATYPTGFTNLGTFTFTNAAGFAETYRDYVSPQSYNVATSFSVAADP